MTLSAPTDRCAFVDVPGVPCSEETEHVVRVRFGEHGEVDLLACERHFAVVRSDVVYAVSVAWDANEEILGIRPSFAPREPE